MAVTEKQSEQSTPDSSPRDSSFRESIPQRISANWFTIGATLLVLIGLLLLSLTLAQNLNQSTSSYSRLSPDDDVAVAQETLRIGDDLQCPICEGQSVAYSNSRLAVEMRAQITKQLEDGSTEAEIKQYFVDRYGEIVLREPPRTGLNLLLWQMPFIAVGLGILALGLTLWRTARNRRVAQPIPAISSTTVSPTTESPTPIPSQQAQAEDANTVVDPELKDLLAQYDKELFQ